VEDPIDKIESARDLMLAVDLSGSMEARDFTGPSGEKITRLEAVKLVLDDFISRRKGDRIGLIFFGTAAFLQVPFTQDHETARLLLEEAQARMAGPQTMLGDAIGLAIQLFEASENETRVLIMLTDGNDTGSKVPPPEAARIAAERNVTIHTVAMGHPESVGEQELDIEALTEIAEATGGEFLHSQTTEELYRDYRVLDEIEPEEYETISYRPKNPLFHWPLGAALAVILVYHLAAGLISLRPKREAAHA
jgi:Ca-activated chloride channel family protein